MDHPTFEGDFNSLVKGVPDLERIVSRIHARNCKVRDFLKVLSVYSRFLTCPLDAFIHYRVVFQEAQQGFRDLV